MFARIIAVFVVHGHDKATNPAVRFLQQAARAWMSLRSNRPPAVECISARERLAAALAECEAALAALERTRLLKKDFGFAHEAGSYTYCPPVNLMSALRIRRRTNFVMSFLIFSRALSGRDRGVLPMNPPGPWKARRSGERPITFGWRGRRLIGPIGGKCERMELAEWLRKIRSRPYNGCRLSFVS